MAGADAFFRLLGVLLLLCWKIVWGICKGLYWLCVLSWWKIDEKRTEKSLARSAALTASFEAERAKNNTLYGQK